MAQQLQVLLFVDTKIKRVGSHVGNGVHAVSGTISKNPTDCDFVAVVQMRANPNRRDRHRRLSAVRTHMGRPGDQVTCRRRSVIIGQSKIINVDVLHILGVHDADNAGVGIA